MDSNDNASQYVVPAVLGPRLNKSRSQTKTKTSEFDYYRGGERWGDQSFADVRFWFPRPDQHHKS